MALSVSTSPELSTLKFSDQGTLILSSSETKKGNSAINSSDVFQIFATYALSTVRVSVDPYGGFWSRTYINASPDWSGGTPLYVSAISGQTGDLTKWQNSAGTVLANVDANGKIAAPIFQSTVAGTAYIVTGSNNNAIRVQTNGTTNVGLIIRGEASQTANLQEWQNSDGTVLSKIDANGLISLPGGSWHLMNGQQTWYKNSTSFYQKGPSHTFRRQSDDTDLFTIGGNGNTSVLLQSASAVGLIVKSAASQTADLQQWQNSAGSVTAKVSSSGAISSSAGGFFGSTDAAASGVNYLAVRGWAADHVPFAVKGFTAQTGDLTRWINDAGTVLTSISSAGKLTSAVDASINGITLGRGAGNISTNIASGGGALLSNTTGIYNSAFGENALGLNTTGSNNTASGVALRSNTTGSNNTASGGGALYSNTTGNDNTAFGVDALLSNNIGNYNTASGESALRSNTTGSYNTASGLSALRLNTTGNNNTALGFGAGYSNTTSGASVFIGYQAGYNETGSNKLYIANTDTATPLIGGDFSAKTLTFAGNATVVSQAAATQGLIVKGAASQTADLQQWQDVSGSTRVAVSSYGTLFSYTEAVFSNQLNGNGTALLAKTNNAGGKPLIVKGAASQTANLTEWQDSAGTVLVKVAADGVVTAGNLITNIFSTQSFGTGSLSFYGIAYNGFSNPSGVTTLPTLVIKGIASQTANLQEWQDSAGTVLASISSAGKLTSAVDASINGVTVGMGAGSASTNTVTGLNALISNTTGTYNTAFGNQSLQLNTSGTQNTAFGQGALYNNRTGWYNTAFGQGALYNNNTAYSNTAIGANALVNNSSGSNNIAVGIQSLLGNNSGGNNIGLGSDAGYSNVTGSSNIFIGHQAGYYETGSNKLYIANSNTTTPLIGGDFSAKTLTFAGNATVVSQAAATQGLIIKGAASQTADLQQWQDSAGTVLAKIMSNGSLFVNSTGTANDPITIQRASATRFKVDPYGNVFAVALTAGNVVNSIAGTAAGIYATSASTIGAVIRGAASQSANLQEWQNSSGTVLSSITNNGFLNTPAILENPTISATAATGTINYDLLTNKSVTYYTSNASANWTLNIRGNSSTTLDSLMAVGQSLTIAFLVTQGSTAYYQSGLQIDGTSVTPKWQGGVAPTFGNASGVDSYSITIMKTASATFTVFESQTRFA